MGRKLRKGIKTSIKADVIVLGCSLPGMVTANKLKKKFGDSMDIVVLDLATTSKAVASKCNVAFQEDSVLEESDYSDSDSTKSLQGSAYESTTKIQTQTLARQYLIDYGNDYKVPIPDAIINPLDHQTSLYKLFQYRNGEFVPCTNHFNDFDYLNFVEKFELNQYQKYLDKSMKRLFQTNKFNDPRERDRLLYYDQTSMEKNICAALIFPTSREIMRTTVKLVCGAPAESVSLLFYLHQCYRTSGTRHHLDGQNTRHREKLLGYCRKRIATQLLDSISDITLTAKPIKHIRSYKEADVAQVVLETKLGETTYICSSLAMALRPEQLQKIEVDNRLLPENEAMLIKRLTPGAAKKFVIQYEESFWESKGYSGDILSVRGPIIWAMPRPRLSLTGSVEKYAAIVGYLMVNNNESEPNSKEAVIEQLKILFGTEAESPVTYRETAISDVFIPCCGDYVGLRVLTNDVSPRGLEWGPLDVFGEGDVAAALEAGHSAYIHLLSCLRPQAQTFEDISATNWPIMLGESPITWWLAHINVMSSIKLAAYTTVVIISYRWIRSYMKQ